MATIEALYIFDEHNNLILNNVYTGRPPPPSTLLPLYLQHPSPRPSLVPVYSTSPPTLAYSIIQDNLLFLSPSIFDIDPLLVLEFLHRVADALEEFLGSPLLATKITANYDIAAQILAEIADAGTPCQSEPNVLRDVVETGPGVLNNLLGKVGLPGSSPALGASGSSTPNILQRPQAQQASAIPWRRSNVRHTNNELYVDMVESLSVTYAPSGRPLAAFANGSIAFNSKVSGVPDLLLNLSTGGKGAGMGNRGDQLRSVMERVVFHPCVRLNKWKSEGVISFVPPDGRFALCGYETDLLGPDTPLTPETRDKLALPAKIEVSTNLGPAGNEFEVRLTLPSSSSSRSTAATASLQSHLAPSASRPGPFRQQSAPEPKGPAFEDLAIHIPIPAGVRNLPDIRPTKGEAHWNPAEGFLEWKISAKETSTVGPQGAVLKCSVQGPVSESEENDEGNGGLNGMTTTTYDYDDDAPQPAAAAGRKDVAANGTGEKFRELMPTSATVSFSVKGWLASGLKVESLLVDAKKSRGLGPEVKPYKGVKYLTVSRGGVEVRC